jgi:hypothetical protein
MVLRCLIPVAPLPLLRLSGIGSGLYPDAEVFSSLSCLPVAAAIRSSTLQDVLTSR